MGLKDELHDIKVMGGLRNYLVTVIQMERAAWEVRRALGEKNRAARKERRLMKTSTFDALTENIGPVLDGDEQIVHEDLLIDTIAVERRRWIERGYWCFALVAAIGLGWLAGWYMQPEYAPQPWKCTVAVHGVGEEASLVDCEGVPE